MSAFLIIDIQNDFCEEGSLAVPNASEIIPVVNSLRSKFSLVIITQDWHPDTHLSFCTSHEGHMPFTSKCIEETGLHQVLWPSHAVQNTFGAELHKSLTVQDTDIIIKKGTHRLYDSYSAFGCLHDRTDLESILRQRNVQKVYLCGLAFDYCVGRTAVDAHNAGFEVFVIKDCTRSISKDSEEKMMEEFNELGIRIIDSSDL